MSHGEIQLRAWQWTLQALYVLTIMLSILTHLRMRVWLNLPLADELLSGFIEVAPLQGEKHAVT